MTRNLSARIQALLAAPGFVTVAVLCLIALAGCSTSYHVSGTDDHTPGWVSIEEFNEKARQHPVTITLVNGSTRRAFDPRVLAQFTEWQDTLAGGSVRVPNDSIRTITLTSWSRGMLDGVLIGIPGILATALVAGSAGGTVQSMYALSAIPAVCAIVGGLRGHTYRYRFLPQQTGLQQEE